MRDKIENVIGCGVILFINFCAIIFGFERIKKLGICILKKYEDKPCEQCKKTNIYKESSD